MATSQQFLQLRTDPGLRPFLIPESCVSLTGRQLGVGSYGSVEDVEIHGVICAGKKIHDALVQSDIDGTENIARKFMEECKLLGELCHPQIVKFLGVYFARGSILPVLLMEKLNTSLDDVLTKYDQGNPRYPKPVIPLDLKLSMLRDVVKGLHYLHTRTPNPIVHRDLSAKNILLDADNKAKITDLGNSRFVSVRARLTLTQLPGTQVYMPPECVGEHSKYDPRLDIFSFGHLALYTLIQIFPCDMLPATYVDDEYLKRTGRKRLLARTEFERRRQYVTRLCRNLGAHHPLVHLVQSCLENDAEDRPSAEGVLQRLEELQVDSLHKNTTKLDVVCELVAQKRENSAICQENASVKQEITTMRGNLEDKGRKIAALTEELMRARRDVEPVRMENEQLKNENEELQLDLDTIRRQVRESQTQIEALERANHELQDGKRRLLAQSTHVAHLSSQLEATRQESYQLKKEKEDLQRHLDDMTHQVATMRQKNKQLKSENEELQQDLVAVRHQESSIADMKQMVSALSEAEHSRTDLSQQLHGAQAQIEALERANRELQDGKRRLLTQATHVAHLSSQLEATRQESDQLKKENEDLQHDLDAMRQQASEPREHAMDMASQQRQHAPPKHHYPHLHSQHPGFQAGWQTHPRQNPPQQFADPVYSRAAAERRAPHQDPYYQPRGGAPLPYALPKHGNHAQLQPPTSVAENSQHYNAESEDKPRAETLVHSLCLEISQTVQGYNNQSMGDGFEEVTPLDPNLVCPYCNRQFRIGEIQTFRRHVGVCNGT